MSSYTITGNTVIFRNPFGEQNIVLKHDKSNYDLIFNSKVRFKKGIDYTTIDLGNFTIKTSDDGDELVISKNDKILFSVKDE